MVEEGYLINCDLCGYPIGIALRALHSGDRLRHDDILFIGPLWGYKPVQYELIPDCPQCGEPWY